MQLLIEKISNLLSWSEDRPASALALMLAASLVIKSLLIFQTEIINIDGIRYVNSAHELFQGHVAAAFSHEKMLGFTFLLGLFHLVIPDWFLAGKVLSCVALVMTTIPLFLITQQLFGKRAALFTALIFTVVPSINEKATAIIKDPTFLFLIIFSLWLVIYADKESRWGFYSLAGSCACLSILIRPEGLIFFATISFFLAVSIVFTTDERRLRQKSLLAFWAVPLVALFVATIMIAAGILPFGSLSVIYDRFAYYFQFDFMHSYKSIYQHLKDAEAGFSGGQWTNDFFEYARYNIFLIYLFGMIQTFSKALFPLFLIPLIFGLNLRHRINRQSLLLLTVLVCFFLMDYLYLVLHNFLSARYLLVPVVLSFILVGHGTNRMIDTAQSLQRRKIVISITLVLCVFLPLGKMLFDGSHEKIEIKEAGMWLREHESVATNRILVSDERIAFYAGLLRGDYVTFPGDDINRFEEKALREDCHLLVIYKDIRTLEKAPDLEEFVPVETFTGRKKLAIIYERKS